jgi:uncharacterized phage protein (TIGR01671 family)
MRAIKFRAWNTKHKEMLFDVGIIPNKKDISVSIGSDGIYINPSNQDERVLMQYTGLKDSKGVEIYEGDVVYLAGYGDYTVEFPFMELYQASFENDIGSIKGNIHEHPNLLTSTSI